MSVAKIDISSVDGPTEALKACVMINSDAKVVSNVSRGRPRDSNVEERVFDAARRLYAEGGLPSFTFDGIAKIAKVGKGALYLRWEDPHDLLKSVLEQQWSFLTKIDTGSFRNDLLTFASARFDRQMTFDGRLAAHLAADSERSEEIRELARELGRDVNRQFASILTRATVRSELPADVDAMLILDTLVGAIANRIAVTPLSARGKLASAKAAFIDELVDFVIGGVEASTKGSAKRAMPAR